MCVITPISSWGAYIIALIGGILAAHEMTEISAISAFVQMIPMNLYAVFTLLMVLAVIFLPMDIGPMRQHEAWAREGKLWDESKGRPAGLDMEGGETARGTMIDMVLPIAVLTITTLIFMIQTGNAVLAANGEAFSLIGALENTNVAQSLVYAALCSLAVSIVLSLRLKLSAQTWLSTAPKGLWR